jgi:hypothetical protein
MISEKQLEANRRNAEESTGPRTEAGKARVRLNAGRHGFTGQILMMSDATHKAYTAFCNPIIESFAPEGPFERQLAHSIAEDSWRLNPSAPFANSATTAPPAPRPKKCRRVSIPATD